MSTQLKNRKIILGVTGGIAAYKACTLCRLLIKSGADVFVVMTPAATKLVGKATFEALSGHPVAVDVFEDSKDISHIALVQDADLVLIAPATANTIAKIACGFADNMLTTLTLAATCPVVVAPAMNTNMYKNLATQANINTLVSRGIYVIEPASGELACHVNGEGRMKEPEDIFDDIISILASRLGFTGYNASLPSPSDPLKLTETKLLPKSLGVGLKVLITAGPTAEAIDPIRYISNNSSGKMGYNLALAAQQLGADVTIVSGPVNLPTPRGVRRIDVKTALQMLQAVEDHVQDADVFIGCAAVADFRVENESETKIKKKEGEDTLTLKLVKNPDIIATVAKLEHHRPFTVGFAAETDNGEINAKAKLERKNLDMIILNEVSRQNNVFNSNENEVTVFDRDGKVAHFERQPKSLLARELMEIVLKQAKESK